MTKTIALLTLLLAVNAHAADEKPAAPSESEQATKSYVAGQLGVAIVTSTGGGTYLTYSGRAGTGLFQDKSGILSLGVYVGSFANSATVSGITADGRLTTIMAELLDRRAFGTGLYFGGRAGLGISSVTVSGGMTSLSASGSSFAFAPVAGYELTVAPRVSVVGDVSWLNRTGVSMTFPGAATVTLDSASALMLQAGVAFHF